MSDFFSFRRMITPILVQMLFWIGVVVVVITGLALLFGGDNGAARFGGLMLIPFGLLAVRVYCELLILFFRMNETLTDISKSLRSSPSTQSTAPQAGRHSNAPQAGQQPKTPTATHVVVTDGVAKLHREPNEVSEALITLRSGQVLKLLETPIWMPRQQWIRVRLEDDNLDGYVSGFSVKVTSS